MLDVNHSLVANFRFDVPQRTITTVASPVAGGGTSGGGIVNDGTSVTVVATPNAGYSFTNWTEAGVQVSVAASDAFNATADRTLVANFTPASTITASAWPVGGGTVLGAASVTAGSSITLLAAPAPDYSFVDWTDALGNEVSVAPSYTFTPTASADYTENFSNGTAGIHFDTAAPALALHTALPITQTVAGLTATFTSPDATPPTIETVASKGYVLSKFAGHFVAPSIETDNMIEVHFDAPISGVVFDFATVEDPGVAVGSNLHLIAKDTTGAAPVIVGSSLAHGTTAPGDSFPTGTLTFNSAVPFDTIRIELAAFPTGAQKLLIDNLSVSPAGSTGGTMLLANFSLVIPHIAMPAAPQAR